jgi:hypothetical protein
VAVLLAALAWACSAAGGGGDALEARLDVVDASRGEAVDDLRAKPEDLRPSDAVDISGDLPGLDATPLVDADVVAPEAGASDVAPLQETASEAVAWVVPTFEGSGYFRTAWANDRWWLVTPDGQAFYSVGINNAGPGGYVDRTDGSNPYAAAVTALYPDEAAWAATAGDHLEAWGFNTLGAWSRADLLGQRFPYAVVLYISGSDWLEGNVPDYFAPEFEARCAEVAASQVEPRRDDPRLLGWFLDNELRWGPDWRSESTLLQDYLALPEGSPGRAVAETFGDDASGFLSALASRYFQVTTTAVRAVDPHHLLLGVRAVSVLTPPEVPPAAAPWLDVFSVNNYAFVPGLSFVIEDQFGPQMPADDMLAAYAEATGLPLLITEFSFRALDSGLPNTYPPIYPKLATQAQRADRFEQYARDAYARPWIVGHHWFEYVDEPPGGRFDGENSNFGLVSGADVPWTTLTERMGVVHAQAPHLAPPPEVP